MFTALTIRPAIPADADVAVPLIYSSGPAAFDYVFAVPGRASAQSFLHQAFVDGEGEFGHRNHVVVEADGAVAGIGAAWTASANFGFTLAATRQIYRCYGLAAGIGVAVRGLLVEAVVQPPRRGAWYVAHLGVRPDFRSRGVGVALVQHLLAEGRRLGCHTAELDVATTNPRAAALYQRLGFRLAVERVSRLSNARGVVPNHQRMVLPLATPAPSV